MTSPVAPTPDAIRHAVELLRAGQLVGFPTETVYGLGADASNPVAVARIFAAKGRPSDHPVIVHVAPDADIARWATGISAEARQLMAAYWPGPLTLVMARAPGVLDAVTGGQDTVGLRCPAHPVAQQLLAQFDGGVAAPSANRFGRISATTAQHVCDEFGDAVPWVIDGGPCDVGIESTIVDVSAADPVLLRPGHVSAEELASTLGRPVLTRAQLAAGRSAPRVSGALAAHYAPRTPLQLVPGAALPARLDAALEAGLKAGVWSMRDPGRAASWLQAPADAVTYAHDMYAVLRQLDTQGLDVLLLETPPAGEQWSAIHDRLGRAAVGSGQA
jgi:L-threonylcarbamoyladenylate synthase